MNTANVWLITAKTNLHVGNENTSSYGLIDKSVQRDTLSGLPCINGSSLKGALNEFFAIAKNKDANFLKEVFGVDKKGRDLETQKGSYAFFDAQLLSIPVQSNNKLFYRATTLAVLEKFIQQLNIFGIKYPNIDLSAISPQDNSPIVFSNENTQLGDFNAVKGNKTAAIDEIEKLIGKDIALFSENDFKELCNDDNLPIIARNKLDNGESKNLWYEQVIPQETIFYSLFLNTGNESIDKELNNQIVQIGANATIGYGYCELKKI